MMQLRDYQIEAIRKIRDAIRRGKRRIVIQVPTGGGKTVVAGQIIAMAQDKGKKVAFTVPSLTLIDQTVKRFWQHGIRSIGVMQAMHEMTDPTKPVQVCSVQTLARRGVPTVDLAIVDECHVVFDLYKKWFNDPAWANVPIIGLTATPWAKGMGKLWDELIVVTTTQDLIDSKTLSGFRVFAQGHPDLSGVRTVRGDYDETQLGDVMNKTKLVADIVSTWLEKASDRPTLCFCVNRLHAKAVRDSFDAAGVRTAYCDAFTDLKERESIGERFNRGEIDVVCNVGVLTTGVDWDVRCIILARPTKSEMLYCLDSETEILTSHGWAGMGEVKEGDCVASMADLDTGRGQWARVMSVIERDMNIEERWVSYKGPRSNFRVTDQHRMLCYSSNDKKEKYELMTALDMSRLKGSVIMPTAVHMEQSGVPLTDDELYFIGMMMSDGTWGSTAGSISQSERHPDVQERIEKCLKGCGIGYSKRKIPPPAEGQMRERFARWVYYFSAGKPKAHGNINRGPKETKRVAQAIHGVTGFQHLTPYMDKDFSPALMGLSKSQFLVLLQGINDGDGFKLKSPSVDWTPRSWTICSVRKTFVDRLQALASINGFTGHVRSEHSGRDKPIWLITITPQDWRSVGGYNSASRNPRPQIEVSDSSPEKVWCVETETGTIVTRRRGKVTVMGNCQIIGRGLRTADGKDYCMILDHSDTTLNLGFVTDIHHDELDMGIKKQTKPREAPLPKECPQCHALRPPKILKCESCGFEAKPVNTVWTAAGELVEIIANGRSKTTKASEYTTDQREQFFRELLCYARERGYQDGWAYWAYLDKFGIKPSNQFLRSPAPNISDATHSWITHRNIAQAKRREAQRK